jgi:hypothetical protein
MSMPTVGRIVHYYPVTNDMYLQQDRKSDTPLAAVVVGLNGTSLNLTVFSQRGAAQARCGIPFVEDEPTQAQKMNGGFCVWPPMAVSDVAPLRTEAPRPVTTITLPVPDASPDTPAPRVTPADIDNAILHEIYFSAADGALAVGIPRDNPMSGSLKLVTFCVLMLRNGYKVVGTSACVSAANYDAVKGRTLAREDAVDKMWSLLGYALAEKLASKL